MSHQKVHIYDILIVMSDTATGSAAIVAAYIQMKMESMTPKVLQKDIYEAIKTKTSHKSKGYTSERMTGKYAWSIPELDVIAPLLGCRDSFDIMNKAREWHNANRVD